MPKVQQKLLQAKAEQRLAQLVGTKHHDRAETDNEQNASPPISNMDDEKPINRPPDKMVELPLHATTEPLPLPVNLQRNPTAVVSTAYPAHNWI
jgi:hypothetical protein